MARKKRRGPTASSRSRRGRAAAQEQQKGGGWFGLLLVVVVLGGAYVGIAAMTWVASVTGALAATESVGVVAFVGGIALGGVGSLFALMALAAGVQSRFGRSSLADAPAGPGGRVLPTPKGTRAEFREAGRSIAEVTAPARTPRERDRQGVVLLATVFAALAPALAMVLLAGLLVALSAVLPEAEATEVVLNVLACLLALPAVMFAGPLAYQWVTGRDVHEYPGSLAPRGISKLRRKGRPPAAVRRG